MIATLLARLRGLSARRPSLTVGLVGAPGTGKTYVFEQLVAGLPYQHLYLPAKGAAASLRSDLPKGKREPDWVAHSLAQPAALPPCEALAARLAGLAPLAVFIDDIHELGPAQTAWLQELAQAVRRIRGVGLLVSSRTRLPEPFEPHELAPLTRQECQNLLQRQLGHTLPEGLLDWLYERTAGNPLFTLEFFRQLSREGALWNDQAQWRWRKPAQHSLPDSVEAVIWQQLQEVQEPSARQLLEVQAYLETRLPDLPHLLDAEPEAQHTLELHGVLRAGQFCHPLYREVAFAQLPVLRRQALAMEVLARPDLLAVQGVACLSDASLSPAQEQAWLERASVEAQERGDPLLGAHLLARAARLATGQQRGELAWRAACGLREGADTDTIVEMAELAAQCLPDPSEALLALAARQAHEGKLAELEQVLERLPAPVRQSDRWPELEIQLLFNSTQFPKVLERWQSRPGWSQRCSPSTAYYVGYSLIDGGDMQAAEQLAYEVLGRLPEDDPGRAELYDILSLLAFYNGQYSQALAQMNEVIEVNRRTANWAALANNLRNRSVTLLQLAQYRQSLAGFQEAEELYQRRGSAVTVAQTQVMACDAYLGLGEYAHTDARLRAALSVLENAAPQAFLVHGLVKRARLYLAWQPPHGAVMALRSAGQALEAAQGLQSPALICEALTELSRAQMASRQPELALDTAIRAEQAAQELGYPEAQVAATQARAEALEGLGRSAEALTLYRAAAKQAQDISLLLEVQQLKLEIARLEGDLQGVSGCLAWFEKMDFPPSRARALQVLHTLRGEAVTIKPAIPHEGAGLCLEALGTLQVRSGQAVQVVRGAQRGTLLLLLLEAKILGQPGVSRLELIDTLYPGQDEAAALANLKAAVFKARAAHSPALILTTPDGYALGIGSDVGEFLASGNPGLWRGMYAGLALGPAGEVSDALLHTGRQKVSELMFTDSAEAARLSAILHASDPYDLPTLNLHCQALHAAQQGRTLKRTYERARLAFAQIGETLPAHWSTLRFHKGVT